MPLQTEFSNSDAQILGKEKVYKGFFTMTKYQLRHRLFVGGWSPVITREILLRGHAVAVLPYDPVHREFVLIEQFRLGAMATSNHPWLLEVIAGIIEQGEDPGEVCRREAHEEAGLNIIELHKALTYLSSPGGTSERLHVYIARVDASNAGGIHGLDHEGEDIRVIRVSEDQAFSWMQNGKIDNAASLIALQWFFINKQKLLDEWNID